MANGLESAGNSLGRIDPSSLIGRPDTGIVEPRAVASLTQAFRDGVVTADDVVARLGELGKTKKKAELMQAQEAVSPEAQALRAQQVAAGTEQAALAEAQALRSQVLEKYPAIAYFDKLAPAAGIQAPTLPDGSPDYPQMEKIGAQLAVHQAQRAEAQARLDNIVDEKQGNMLFSKTKQGEIVDQDYVADLRRQATAPFQQQAPGTVQTMVEPKVAAPAMVPAPAMTPAVTSEPIDQLRARMAEKFGIEKVIQLSEDELRRLDTPSPMVEPRAAAPAVAAPMIGAAPMDETPPAGTRVGAGTSLGPLPAKPALAKPIDPIERAQQLAAAEGQLPIIANAAAAVTRETGIGPAEGSLLFQLRNRIGAALGLGREQEFEDQRTLEMGISSKILEGAQVMKGNLSDKDVNFLKATVPKLTDTEEVWQNYLNRWNQMALLNIDILRGKVPPQTGDLFAPQNWTAPAELAARENGGNLFAPTASTTKSSTAPVITLSSGKRVQRDANGNFQPVQ